MLAVQNFAHYGGNTLHIASGMLADMKCPLSQIVAANIIAARAARGIDSYRALASRAKVAPNTVRNIEEPDTRAPTKRGETAPRMDILEKLAHAMGFETWHLLVENFDPNNPPPLQPPTARELMAHRRIESAYRALRESDDGEPVE